MKKEEVEELRNKEFKTEDVYLAEVRYFSKDRQSFLTLPDEEDRVFVILLKQGYRWCNIMQPDEVMPVYGRSDYSDTLANGENHGNLIMPIFGEFKEGFCCVLCPKPKIFSEKDTVTFEEIWDYVLQNDRFFPDRLDLIKNRVLAMYQDDRIRKWVAHNQKLDNFNNTLNESGCKGRYRQ